MFNCFLSLFVSVQVADASGNTMQQSNNVHHERLCVVSKIPLILNNNYTQPPPTLILMYTYT